MATWGLIAGFQCQNKNQNQNRSIDKIQNLGKKEGKMQRVSPRFRSQQFF